EKRPLWVSACRWVLERLVDCKARQCDILSLQQSQDLLRTAVLQEMDASNFRSGIFQIVRRHCFLVLQTACAAWHALARQIDQSLHVLDGLNNSPSRLTSPDIEKQLSLVLQVHQGRVRQTQ